VPLLLEEEHQGGAKVTNETAKKQTKLAYKGKHL
jgi:hypothetical protein